MTLTRRFLLRAAGITASVALLPVGTTATWDAAACRFTGNDPEVAEANKLLRPTYRAGWTAPGIGA